MTNHLQWPWFIQILRDVQNGRGNQWHTIHMSGQDGPFRVNANTIQTALCQFLTCPSTKGITCRSPYFLLQLTTGTTQSPIFHRYHGSRGLPIVSVSVAYAPLLWFSFFIVPFPKFLDKFPNLFRCSNLFVSDFGVILHTLWLSKRHVYSITFRVHTAMTSFAVELDTVINKIVINLLSVTQRLDWHVHILFGDGQTRILIVRQPIIVVRDFPMMHGKRNIYSV
mmetsp:Transcript_15740/g.20529  ORF Transcript_15740/g.20529 Transcript_15740/m.20529 type:complete len:224 (+) Transcript_15740:846-1517(+)